MSELHGRTPGAAPTASPASRTSSSRSPASATTCPACPTPHGEHRRQIAAEVDLHPGTARRVLRAYVQSLQQHATPVTVTEPRP